jgi:hypothetical protein
VGDQRLVEELLVFFLQRRQQHVAIDVAGQAIEVRHHALHHLPRRGDAVGQQPAEAETIPFLRTEGDRSVERLVTQNVEAAFHGFLSYSREIIRPE